MSEVEDQQQSISPSDSTHAQLIAALQQNWRREVEGARLYRDLAARESDANKRGVLERLAEAEEGVALGPYPRLPASPHRRSAASPE